MSTSQRPMSSIVLASQRGLVNPDVTQLFTRKELVGKGAYGGVYKGVHNSTGLVVALKVIDLDSPDDDINEIQKEVALLSEMRDANRHNITLYHGCYLHGHELWIAMDFASGGSVRTLMKSGTIEEKYIVLIVREVLVALSFLHRQGIIHRDVKAANILLTQANKILLCDFGVAAHLQTNNKRSTFIGTPLWMAPEVITDGKLYDTKADIWSLGVTLFEVATGNPPYFGMEPLRACALIPRTAPAKLEGGTWSLAMREFLGMCLQVDPTHRPTADELSRTKWIKSASKMSTSVLRELIARYVSWIQTGGQRQSLAGMDSLVAREDTFEIEEDHWDFGNEEDEFDEVEPLGDEPPRSLDAQAAISQLRPPKPSAHAVNLSRNHPLLRLFDEESNPYAQPTNPTIINLPTGNSTDTVRPTISIPSFEDMDSMFESQTATKFGQPSEVKFGQAADELVSPAAPFTSGNRPNPFSWTTQPQSTSSTNGGGGPSSPFMRSHTPYGDEDDGPWGSQSGTPTDANFPDLGPPFPPVTSSPSLPSMSFDRPFLPPTRRRADTAPSSDYPPLGPGIPSPLPTPTHSATTSISSGGGGSYFHQSNGTNTSISSYSTTTASPPGSSHSRPTFSGPGMRGRAGTGERLGGGGEPDHNRPFRERKASDAAARPFRMPNDGGGGGGMMRPRTASETRPSGLHSKHGLKLHITTSSSSSVAPLQSHSRTNSGILAYQPPYSATTPTPLHWTDPSFISSSLPTSSSQFDLATPLAHSFSQSSNSSTSSGFPFPSAPILPPSAQFEPEPLGANDDDESDFDDEDEEEDFDEEEDLEEEEEEEDLWPVGPELRALDYGKLRTKEEVHDELERTLGELGKWLSVVDDGLSRILDGKSNSGEEVGGKEAVVMV